MSCPKFIGDVKLTNKLQAYINSIELKLLDAARKDDYFDNVDINGVMSTLFSLSADGFGLDWLTNQYRKQNFKISEGKRYKEILELYHIIIHTVSGKEIFEYKNIDELATVVEKRYGKLSNNEILRNIKDNETIKLIDTLDVKVIIPLTESAAKIYGKSTKWCLSGDFYNEFLQYKELGHSYIVIVGNRKFAFHLEKQSFVNEINEFPTDIEIRYLNTFGSFLSFMTKLFNEVENIGFLVYMKSKGLKF